MKTRNFIATTSVFIITSLFISGCNNKNSSNVFNVGSTVSNKIDVISVYSGWYGFDKSFANVKVIFKNNSGSSISNEIKAKCQFIKDDEVVEKCTISVHSCDEPDWGVGEIRKRVFVADPNFVHRTIFDLFSLSSVETPFPMQARITYEDGSLIWEGDIEMTKLGDSRDPDYYKIERYYK